ncbi:UDP-N-acetylglucosamine 2-epimerase [Candidatus Altiarchaeota archaeon]
MIHLILGTKAQFIKTAPVILELEKRSIDYNFIDTGQHAEITTNILEIFRLRAPDIKLFESNKSISSLSESIKWAIKILLPAIIFRNRFFQRVFKGEPGVCLIHGDTASTLLGLVLAKLCGIKVAHLESGLRSKSFFDPFPEELIRHTVCRYSDILFATSKWAYENLSQLTFSGEKFDVGGNTILESIDIVLDHEPSYKPSTKEYIVLTIHRFETITSKKRLQFVVELIEDLAQDHHIIFVMHPPTEKKFSHYGLLPRLKVVSDLEILPLLDYVSFVHIIRNASHVITDGGSIQEECSYLGEPCLLLRKRTERIDGVGENVVISGFNKNQVKEFFQNPSTQARKIKEDKEHPSKKIVDVLVSYNQKCSL